MFSQYIFCAVSASLISTTYKIDQSYIAVRITKSSVTVSSALGKFLGEQIECLSAEIWTQQ
jgi:hypothetical protein